MFKNRFHPGIYLQEFLDEFAITAYRLAKDTQIPQTRVSQILKGKRGISIDTAMRFSKYFGNSAEQWLNLQRSYDLYNFNNEDLDAIQPITEYA